MSGRFVCFAQILELLLHMIRGDNFERWNVITTIIFMAMMKSAALKKATSTAFTHWQLQFSTGWNQKLHLISCQHQQVAFFQLVDVGTQQTALSLYRDKISQCISSTQGLVEIYNTLCMLSTQELIKIHNTSTKVINILSNSWCVSASLLRKKKGCKENTRPKYRPLSNKLTENRLRRASGPVQNLDPMHYMFTIVNIQNCCTFHDALFYCNKYFEFVLN